MGFCFWGMGWDFGRIAGACLADPCSGRRSRGEESKEQGEEVSRGMAT